MLPFVSGFVCVCFPFIVVVVICCFSDCRLFDSTSLRLSLDCKYYQEYHAWALNVRRNQARKTAVKKVPELLVVVLCKSQMDADGRRRRQFSGSPIPASSSSSFFNKRNAPPPPLRVQPYVPEPVHDPPLPGMIFGCTTETYQECMARQLFGLPERNKNQVWERHPCTKNLCSFFFFTLWVIKHVHDQNPRSGFEKDFVINCAQWLLLLWVCVQVLRVVPGSKLFLFNYRVKEMSGIFEATCHGGMNIVRDAFNGWFPAQVSLPSLCNHPSI